MEVTRTLGAPQVARVILLMCLAFGGAWAGVQAAANEIVLYVSPAGSDKWSGSLEKANARKTDGPLATVEGARDMLRSLRAQGRLNKAVRVVIGAGTYRVDDAIVFEAQDSGSSDHPITYEGNPDAPPVISGGRPITGWTKSGLIWSVQLPEVQSGDWSFSSIWVNGERRRRAKTPNDGFFSTAGKLDQGLEKDGFRFRTGDIQDWSDVGQAVVVAYHSWETSIHRVAAVDMATNSVTFANPSMWPFENWGSRQRYQVENVASALDSPGEWYANLKSGILSYMPMPGEDMTTAAVVAPVAGSLLALSGYPGFGEYITNLHFRNIRFLHTDFSGALSGQADWQAAFTVPAAIEAVGARDCTIRRCEIAAVGTHAIWLREGCKGVRIEHNEIHDMAAGGVYVGEASVAASPELVCGANVIDNNFIHDGTKLFHGAVGVWIGKSSYNRVSHNEICDMDYTGVSVGWTWGYAPSEANNNIIEYNHIHHLGRGLMGDMGGIYTLGISPGTIERYNLIHDVNCFEGGYGGWGTYTDEGSTGILVENNIVYNTTSSGFHQHYGQDNIIRNNIYAFGRDGQLQRSRMEPHQSFALERNIIVANGQPMLASNWGDGKYTIDSNLYWDYAREPLFAGMSFRGWQGLKRDVKSVVADPLFANPLKGDFTLAPDSPAIKLGFVPIDSSKIGLFGEPEWVARPRQIERVEYVPAAPKAQQPIRDGFEDSLPGSTPQDATAMEDGLVGTVRVTGETAAVGKQSLRVRELPGCKNSWDPHVYYTTKFVEGFLVESFWMKVEKGTAMYHEWRDAMSPYTVGPRFEVTAQGKLRASTASLQLEPGGWTHIEMSCGLGGAATGKYTLVVTPQGKSPVRFEGLNCSKKFRELNWLGWVSTGTTEATFYLDEVQVGPMAPKGPTLPESAGPAK